MTDTKMLDEDVRATFNDRALLHRVVTSIALDQDLPYVDALEQLHEGVDGALHSGAGRATATLGEALSWTRSEPDDIEQSVKLLERRDEAVSTAYEHAAGPIMLEAVDAQGMVLLEQGDAGDAAARGAPLVADIGEALANPAERERRFARARRLDAAYQGIGGRERFDEEDRRMLEGGVDLVRTLERAVEDRAAQAHAQRVGAQLDETIREAGDKRQKLRLLDAQIAKLEGAVPGVTFDGARDQLRSRAVAAGREPLKLLDRLSAVDDVDRASIPSSGHELYEQTQERLRLLDRPQSDFIKTMQEVLDGKPARPTSSDRAEPEIPAGVHPGSHKLHQRVRERMRELDRGENDYAKTLEEVLREL